VGGVVCVCGGTRDAGPCTRLASTVSSAHG
jgi:hypothetical protein